MITGLMPDILEYHTVLYIWMKQGIYNKTHKETPKLHNERLNCATCMHSCETLGELPDSVDISAKGSDIGSLNVNSVSVNQYHHGTVNIYSEIHPGNLILQFPSKGIHLCNLNIRHIIHKLY